jgi:hypothetical protein
MTTFFDWLSNNPIATTVFIVAFSSAVTCATLIYMIAFLQGREISFWPPKVGEKPSATIKPRTLSKLPANTKRQNPRPVDIVFMPEPPSVGEYLTDLDELYVLAINSRRLVTNHYGILQGRLAQGATIRFLLVDPDGDTIPVIARRNFVYREPEQLREAIRSTLDNLTQLRSDQLKKGTIETRVFSYAPAFSMIAINPRDSDGKILVSLYPYSVPPESNPSFWIEKTNGGEWYEFFLKQFDMMWETATDSRSGHSSRVRA